mmetsp:Transcript_69301/g.203418  ORF Transcript_69301/g.203418 Transcript_69301/m.203418 type:complete len:421 (+) Transcript_69301:241-1503(+)
MHLDAGGLEVLVVLGGLSELLVNGLQVLDALALLELSLVLLQLRLDLALVLDLLAGRRLGHEGVVLPDRGLLGHGGLALQAPEVAQDDFEHADDAALAALHALVGGHLRRLLLLDEGGLGGVELLQDDQGVLDGLIARRGVRDDGRVLGLLLLAQLGRLLHGRGQVLLLLRQRLDLLAERGDGGGLRLDLGHELVGLRGLRVALLLVHLELLVAPGLVVGLRGGLLLQLRDELLDHADDLLEGVGRHLLGEVRERLRLQGHGGLAQEHGGLFLRLHAALGAAELDEGLGLDRRGGCGGLRGLRQVDALLVGAGHGAAGHDLERLRQGLDLGGADLLVLLEGRRLLLVDGLRLRLQLLVRGLVRLGRRELALGLGRGGRALALRDGLLLALRGGVLDGVAEVKLLHLEGVLLVGLGLLDIA